LELIDPPLPDDMDIDYLPTNATQDTTDSFLTNSQTTTDSFLTSSRRLLPLALTNHPLAAQATLSRLLQRVPDAFLPTFTHLALTSSPPFPELCALVTLWEATDAPASASPHHAQCRSNP
jgi:hypothetical protein